MAREAALISESDESWDARYGLAMQTGRDDLGNDVFDLWYEKFPNEEFWVHFDGSFWREDQVRAVEVTLTGWGYEFVSGPRLTGHPTERWMIYVGKDLTLSAPSVLRDEVAQVMTLFESQGAFDDDWDIEVTRHP